MRRGSRAARKKKGGFPVFPILVLVAVVGSFVLYWYVSSAEMRKKKREARNAIVGIGPEEMAEKLLANEELPDVIPLEVSGVLDIRFGHYECEYTLPATMSGRVTHLTSLKVYGLLFAPDSRVSTHEHSVRSLAEEAFEYQEAFLNMDMEEYDEVWHELAATYEDLSAGPAILVELQKGSHCELYEQVGEEALKEVNSGTGIPHDATIIRSHRCLTTRLLNPEYLMDGLFHVQIVEHNEKLAKEIQGDIFTGGVQIIRTVKEM